MLLSFTLAMPGCNSWNGKWSGEGRHYVRIVNFGRSKKQSEAAAAILAKPYYRYDFGDGWAAAVSVAEVTSADARALRVKSDGFCGYEWMIDSIRQNGRIKGT